MTITLLREMASGECRWIGRHDLHAYCHAPFVRTTRADGRTAWGREPGAARYSIVCPAAGLAYGTWVPLDEAAVLCDRILAGLEPAAAA